MHVPAKWRLNKVRLGVIPPPNRGGENYRPFNLEAYKDEQLARKNASCFYFFLFQGSFQVFQINKLYVV